jgi:hypothetical protein
VSECLRGLLAVGARLAHDGQWWQVAELNGPDVLLSAASGVRRVSAGHLLADPSTRLDGAPVGPVGSTGAELAGLGETELAELRERVAHVQEVRTGFRRGCAELAAAGEPRPEYAPGVPMLDRYAAKAAEIRVGVSTLRRWVKDFGDRGPAGLADYRRRRRRQPLAGADPRWLETARQVLASRTDASRPTQDLVLAEIAARLDAEHGAAVPVPSPTRARLLLREISRGHVRVRRDEGQAGDRRPPGGALRAAAGDAAGRVPAAGHHPAGRVRDGPRDIAVGAGRADGRDGPLRQVRHRAAAHPGLDQSGRRGGRAVRVRQAAARPGRRARRRPAALPRPAGRGGRRCRQARRRGDGTPLLPSVAAETIVVDHGKIYLSEHLMSACARLGISVQPARVYQATDKGPLERWFRALGEQLLAALPGYKGPDVYRRGKDPEQQAFYFLSELEQIVRRWTADCYHRQPHAGLCVPEVPGLEVSPLEMFAHGIARAGYLQVPARADLVFDFLKVEWRTIQHYGVEIGGLRYDGAALNPYRNRTSPYSGEHAGRWRLTRYTLGISR